MADKLTYNGKTYTINTDGARIDSLVSTAAYMGDSLPSAELSVDTLNATLRDYDTELRPLVAAGLPVVVGGQLAAAQCRKQRLDQGQIYGSKVRYYHDDSLLDEFRLECIKRVGSYEYSLSCVSAIGLLITSNHYGGIYTGETAAEVMADIVGGIIPYTLAPELASVPIRDSDDLQALLDRLLRSSLREGTPSIALRRFPSASWRYHIQPEQEVQA